MLYEVITLTAVRATLGALPGDPAPDTAAPALPLTGEATREVIEGGGNQSSIRT